MPTTTIVNFTGSIDSVSARTDSAGTPVTPDWKAEERRMSLALFTEGIVKPDSAWKVNPGAGSTMNVVVGSGSAETDLAVVEGQIQGQGNYVVRLDEVTKTFALAAADPSNPRIDEVYLVVLDNAYDAGGFTLPQIGVRKGDPASSPASPGPDVGWDAYLLLASINVPAAAADILSCTITDSRVYSGLTTVSGALAPTGSIMIFAGSVAPDGWIFCHGQQESRTTRARLFAVIGETYGPGDGSTTFNVPGLQQRFPLGKAAIGTGSVLGDTGGSIDHLHTGPSHTHTGPSHTHSQPSHTHAANPPPTDVTLLVGGGAEFSPGTGQPSVNIASFNTGADGGDTTGASGTGATGASGTGSTSSHNPPYLVLNHIIKT